jgi:hypothetical protein
MMKRILQNSFFKCIGPENKSGITFFEVVVVGVLMPMVVKNVKNYVINIDRHIENQDNYTV